MVTINDPAFDEDIYTLEFPPGTHVRDDVTNSSFTIPGGDAGVVEGSGASRESQSSIRESRSESSSVMVDEDPNLRDQPPQSKDKNTKRKFPWLLILLILLGIALASGARVIQKRRQQRV